MGLYSYLSVKIKYRWVNLSTHYLKWVPHRYLEIILDTHVRPWVPIFTP